MKERLSAKDRLAGIFIWLYLITGSIGIVVLITSLLPFHSQLLGLLLCIVVPCTLGWIYEKYVVIPARTELEQSKRRTAELEEAIEKAIIRETTVDLYAYCDPDWAKHIQKIKREAREHRAYQEYVEGLSQSEPPGEAE